MQINGVNTGIHPIPSPPLEPNVISLEKIKAILYLGLRGEVFLPKPEHKVDIIV
ncbi:MAG: hypothetical protein KAU17_09180 [Spirochaetales bacterium]|nr:hypothetical protein [Spirochaetales bacterium]